MRTFSQYIIPVSVSLVLHGLVVGLLFVHWTPEAQEKRIIPPRAIQAKLVQLESKPVKQAAKKQPQIIDLTAKRREAERKKQLAEKRRQQEIKKREQAEAKKAKEQKQKREEQERIRKEQERQQAEQRRQQRIQEELQNDLAEEAELLAEDQYATAAASYADAIRRRIEQHWSRPPSARNGMRCEITIAMVPNGRIVDVNIKTSSGNLAFDRSAVAAVKKVEVFPEAKEIPIEVFDRHFRKFTLAFQPEDLRQ